MAKAPDDPSAGTTIERPRHDPPRAGAATYRIWVHEGVDAGKNVTIDGTKPLPLYIGQGPSCELRLTDRLVSRRHLALDLVDRKLRITDVGSKNGTQANGLIVLDAFLRGGEAIKIGETTLAVELVAPATAVEVAEDTSFGSVFGASTEMRRLYPTCARLAATDVTILVEGETGTGKELLAESLHAASARADAPFIVFDCSTAAPSLLESDLFGHEKGAFTGATGARRGVFEQAHGGTLFIDEIGDLDLSLQPRLLRAIERGEIRRVGGEKLIKVDVRILAATRRDLEREVQAGRFRDDLFHRLAVARIELPPLRRRPGDIALLAARFARELGGARARIPDALLVKWEDYAWPGNVRELRNAVARFVALGEAPTNSSASTASLTENAPTPSDDVVARAIAERLPYTRARAAVLEDFEQRYVEWVLRENGGNVARAAEQSGIARRHFQRVKARSQRD
jgi:transcriptional regulator with GAF, ATPase, and Fis domain